MTEPLPPEQLEELMAGYVLGDLSPEEAEEFRRLVAENPDLDTEVNHLQEALGLMPYALPEVMPPPRLRSAILEATQATGSRPTPKRSLPWSRIAAGVAVLSALALGLDNYNLRQDLRTAQARMTRQQQDLSATQARMSKQKQDLRTAQARVARQQQDFRYVRAQVAQQKDVIAMLQQPRIYLVSLKGLDPVSAASGSFVMNPSKPGAFLVLQNLPPLPADQVYELWSIVNGKKIAQGQFNTSPEGKVLVKFPVPANAEVATLEVTLESSSTSPRSVGPTVMTTETIAEL